MAYRLPNGYGSIYKLSGNRRKPWAARRKDNGQGVTETVYTHLELPIKLEAINKI